MADRKLMAEVSQKFKEYRNKRNLRVEDAARELGVSRASFYKYEAKKYVPRIEVLRRAHRKWGMTFTYADFVLDNEFFESQTKEPGPLKEEQIPLPFIEALRSEDIEILAVVPRKPNAVELKLRISFAS